MTPVYDRHGVRVLHGDALDVLADMPDASVEAVISDPPYSISFMSRSWDAHENPAAFQAWCAAWAAECLRVLRPGGHLAVFGGTRTFHRLACGIEDAGFEIRDSIGVAGWVHGQGMPKHKNQLKPAWEPIVVARKPLTGTLSATLAAHGTGAINVDACRTAHASSADLAGSHAKNPGRAGETTTSAVYGADRPQQSVNDGGRWPTNAVFVHHPGCGPEERPGPCVPGCHVAELDQQSGVTTSSGGSGERSGKFGAGVGGYGHNGSAVGQNAGGLGDTGGASRFFPCFRWEAKAPSSERPQVGGVSHPCVKPLGLMRWLVRLLTPPGGLVLDPFCGSGTTGQAARAESMRAVLVEREDDYIPLIRARLDARERTPASSTGVVSGAEPMDLLDLLTEEPTGT